MATAYAEFDCRADNVLPSIMQRVLASADWAHLQLTTGTAATTLSSAATAGATSVSVAATIPSGSYIVIGDGAANPEVRVTTGVSGAGPFTVTFADALVNSYLSAAAVGVGSIVKATTTRGAQMVVDFADAAATIAVLSLAFYRTHDGTTAVDKLSPRYLRWKNVTGASTDIVHLIVSAGKEHLYVSTEGPRGGEANAESGNGSTCQSIFIGDIVPYLASDTVPAVVVSAPTTSNSSTTAVFANVSRDSANVNSWVSAVLATVAPVGATGGPIAVTQLAADGNTYLFPYVVLESSAGLRGRISKVWSIGPNAVLAATLTSTSAPSPGTTFTYAGETYIAVPVSWRNGVSSSACYNPFYLSTINQGLILGAWVGAVPKA